MRFSDANRPAWRPLRMAYTTFAIALMIGGWAMGQEQEPEPVAPGFPAEPQRSGAKPPPLIQVSPVLSFGYMAPGGFATDLITIMNDSEETLHLTEAKGDCECTVPVIQQMTLEPGEATEIVVELNAPADLGRLQKTIFVFAEGYDAPFQSNVFAEIGHAVRVNGGQNRSLIVSLEGSFRLDSVDEKPFSILAINGRSLSQEDYVDFDPLVDKPRTEYLINYNYREEIPERLIRYVLIETDHPEARMFGFPAFLPGALPLPTSPEWFPRKKEVLIPDLVGGHPHRVAVEISGTMPNHGDQLIVSSSNPDVSANIVGLGAAETGRAMRIEIDILMRFGTNGYHKSILTVEMTGGHFATFEVYIRAVETDTDKAALGANQQNP